MGIDSIAFKISVWTSRSPSTCNMSDLYSTHCPGWYCHKNNPNLSSRGLPTSPIQTHISGCPVSWSSAFEIPTSITRRVGSCSESLQNRYGFSNF